MGSFGIWHWLVVIAVVALLFGGRGKISSLMGDVAHGIKAFRKGMSDDDTASVEDQRGNNIDPKVAEKTKTT